MPLVNLIQEQRLATARGERKTRVLFFSFVGSVVASVFAVGAISFQTDRLHSEEARLLALAARLKPLKGQIARAEAERARLAPRLKTLEDAQAATNRWSNILQHLATNTPSQTWLTNIRSKVESDPTKPIELSLIGMSAAQQPVGEFMLRTQNSRDLEAVNLRYTQEKVTASGASAIEFEVAAAIVGSAQPKPVVSEQAKEGQEKQS